MKPYHHLPGYLHRWRLAGAGRFMLRLHRILKPDQTPFLHTHPFSYLSIVLRGGYTERLELPDGRLRTIRHRPGAVIVRSSKTAHRIEAVEPGCTTLFFTWKTTEASRGEQGWTLRRHADIQKPAGYVDAADGIYALEGGFRKRAGGVWYALRASAQEAAECSRLSIHQDIRIGR